MTEKEFNDYLAEVVNNDDRCKKCEFKQEKGCFFAYDCIKNNHSHLREDKGVYKQ